ncbi:hypothetical protein SuNHUV7_03820 (plasmid) [Pseudoseohaeicola sp. NH-UV-7]
MTFLATCVAFCHMSLSQAAAEATHEAIDLSVPFRANPFLDFPFILTYVAVVSTAIILIAKSLEILF